MRIDDVDCIASHQGEYDGTGADGVLDVSNRQRCASFVAIRSDMCVRSIVRIPVHYNHSELSKENSKLLKINFQQQILNLDLKFYCLQNHVVTARKRSLRRLCSYTCLSVILFTGKGSASVHAGIADSSLLGADPPWEQTRRSRPPPGEQTYSGGRYPPRSRHPTGRRPNLHSACWEIRATSGRYASYWNAYLLRD